MELAAGLFLFIGLLVLLVIRVPIAFAMGAISLLTIMLFIGPKQLPQVVNIILSESTSGTLLVAPMFILMAEILVVAGVAQNLFTVAAKWCGRLPGGLAITSIASSALFSSVTGSSAATVATIGSMSMPEMLRRGYSDKLASGAVVAGGTLGILIPPSIAMIIYGIITETSIISLFVAGIIPGIILTVMLSAAVYAYSVWRPEAAPKGETYSWSERFKSLLYVLPVLVLIVLVLGSMYSGMATITESAGVGATGALLIALAMRRLTWDKLKLAFIRTAYTSCMILFLVFGGMIFSFVVGYLGIPNTLTEFIQGLSDNKWVILLLINLLLLVLGCFLDPLSALVLTMPLLFPVAMSFGFDPVWFGIMMVINAEIGMITPPVGLNLFVLKGTAPQVNMGDIVKGSMPFVVVMLCAMVIFSIFPELVLMLK